MEKKVKERLPPERIPWLIELCGEPEIHEQIAKVGECLPRISRLTRVCGEPEIHEHIENERECLPPELNAWLKEMCGEPEIS